MNTNLTRGAPVVPVRDRASRPQAPAPAPSAAPRPAPARHLAVPDEVRADPDAAWDDEDRIEMIAANAYFRAERRGFLPGHELSDWLEAEREVDAMLRRGA